jgi:hypothetical protein
MLPGGVIAIEIDGIAAGAIDAGALADRPAVLQARDRRAWRLSELLSELGADTHIHSSAVIHARTLDGGDYILSENGRQGDAIVVLRASGELYIGWLDGDPGRPLADAERPAERIEDVAMIAIASPVAPPELPPASVAIVVDGRPYHTLTAPGFAAAASTRTATRIAGRRDGPALAIDVAQAFGAARQVVGLAANGVRVAQAPPSPGARAVIYLTRRARFKFAWIDARGEPIRGTQQREVSELVLETRAPAVLR